MKKFSLLFLLCGLFSMGLFAEETVGDVIYETSGSTATVHGLVDAAATSVVIPDEIVIDGVTYSVTAIDGNFKEFSALTEISIGKNITGVSNEALSGCDALTTINVPDGTLDKYQVLFSSLTNKLKENTSSSVANAFAEAAISVVGTQINVVSENSVRIYGVNGNLVFVSNATNNTFNATQGNVYIVKVGSSVTKVLVK